MAESKNRCDVYIHVHDVPKRVVGELTRTVGEIPGESQVDRKKKGYEGVPKESSVTVQPLPLFGVHGIYPELVGRAHPVGHLFNAQ